MKEKKISVIMGIYNCAETLEEAVNSILNQTYTNWEMIMCDDCSIDDTVRIAQMYVQKYPEKIRLLKNARNMGLNFTLNKCLKEATGDYIARMDGDDISYSTRFEKEVMVLDNNPEIAIVSTNMEVFDEQGVWGHTHMDEKPECIHFLKRSPFCHAACMVRKEAYKAVNGYSVSKKLLRVEDYHLWIKMYELGYKGFNIQESLYGMRDDHNAQKRRKFKYRLNECYVKAYAIKHLGLPFYGYIYCLKPLILGITPGGIYKILHHVKLGKNRKNCKETISLKRE